MEGKAQEFITQKIESETNEKIDSLSVIASESGLGKLASKLMKGQETEIDSLRSVMLCLTRPELQPDWSMKHYNF